MRNFVVNGLLGKNTKAIRNRAMIIVVIMLLAFTGSTYYLTKRLVDKVNRQAVNMAQQTAFSNRNVLEMEFKRAANRAKYLAQRIGKSVTSQHRDVDSLIIE